MEVNHCYFPDNLLYDDQFLVWVHIKSDEEVVIGLTSVHVAMAGKLSSVKIKPESSFVEKDRNLALIESTKYFGGVKSPITGTVIAINSVLSKKSKMVNDYPYDEGWLVVLKPVNLEKEKVNLISGKKSENDIKKRIKELRIRCFLAYPDYEMYEIGIECSAVLMKLDESLSRMKVGEVIHLVTDDPFSDIEMIRWSDQTKQSLLESRKEDNLFHFIVKKDIV